MEEDVISPYTSEGMDRLMKEYFIPLLTYKPKWYEFKLKKEYNTLKSIWSLIIDIPTHVGLTDELKKRTHLL